MIGGVGGGGRWGVLLSLCALRVWGGSMIGLMEIPEVL
jgi:hypothetical protein